MSKPVNGAGGGEAIGVKQSKTEQMSEVGGSCERTLRANKQCERPSDPFEMRLSVTGNVPNVI